MLVAVEFVVELVVAEVLGATRHYCHSLLKVVKLRLRSASDVVQWASACFFFCLWLIFSYIFL